MKSIGIKKLARIWGLGWILVCLNPLWGQGILFNNENVATDWPPESIHLNRIDPPNWWTGMKWNQVQLMLYGHNLQLTSAKFVQEKAPEVLAVHNVANSDYAFIDILIPPDLAPDNYTLQISDAQVSIFFNFPIHDRAALEGRNLGFDQSDVIYLITPDRFANGDPSNDHVEGMLNEFDRNDYEKRHGGDLKGIISRLDYLKDLGITAIWLNPVQENRGKGSYHGYAITDLYKIDPRFGSNADYKLFVEEAHKRGIKVIYDHINNHIGVEHPWLNSVPMPDWFHGTKEEHHIDKHYMSAVSDPHAGPESKQLLKSFWFVDQMPDMNQKNPFLANYLIQNMLWWLEYTGLDGVREDTYPYVYQSYHNDWAKALRAEYPDLNIVGEIWHLSPPFLSQYQEGSPLHFENPTYLPCVMDFPSMQALRNYLAGEGKWRDIYEILAQDFLYGDPNKLLMFGGNHDATRLMFQAKGDTAKVKQVITFVLTSRGIPQVLYGMEIGMLGGRSHVELRADFPGGWEDDQRSAFAAEGRTEAEAEMYDFTRKLLHLRKEHPALSHGQYIHFPLYWRNDMYRYMKVHNDERILIVLNGNDRTSPVDFSEMATLLEGYRELEDLLTGETLPLDQAMEVEAWGLRIWKLNK